LAIAYSWKFVNVELVVA